MSLFRRFELRHWWPLLVALLAALGVRLLLWGNVPRQGLVSDEAEYLASAVWLAQGRGFSWHEGWLWTRAPLYPLFLAVHLRVFGISLVPIYLTQLLLGLAQVVLIYLIARCVCDHDGTGPTVRRWVPPLAALLVALYFPLALYSQVLLSETLYITLIFAALYTLGRWIIFSQKQVGWHSRALLVVAGALLGLATLTRGLALGFVVVAGIWVMQKAKGKRQKAESTPQRLLGWWRRSVSAWCLVLGALVIILPWTGYASRQYGGLVVVDTTGAFNMLLGARTAYDGDRRDAATRTFVLALLDERMEQDERELYLGQSCLGQRGDPRLADALNRRPAAITQAERQGLMSAEGLCLLRAKPLAFVEKSLAEFIDFFRINYGGDERFTDGFTTGRLHPAFVLGTFLLDDTLYVLALPLGVVGWGLARRWTEDRGPGTGDRGPGTRRQGDRETGRQGGRDWGLGAATPIPNPQSPIPNLVALWWLYHLLAAPLLFAINRFRVPLVPLLLLFAAYGVVALVQRWRDRGRRTEDRGLNATTRSSVFSPRSRYELVRYLPHLVLAGLLGFVVLAPASWISSYDPVAGRYRAQESYFGAHPSSVEDTRLALASRPRFWRLEALREALGAGDVAGARAVLDAGGLPAPTALLGAALLAGLEGRPEEGLALLPEGLVQTADDRGWQAQASVVRGDLLRRVGDLGGARAAFTPRVVDEYNPVAWAWSWLHPLPPPEGRIDMGGNLDLGYINGFYLGEGDGKDTWRWSGGAGLLRFPAAGTGVPQTLRLRIDGRSVDLPEPRFSVWVDGREVAALPLAREVAVVEVPLPASPPGADVIVTLRAPVFVPPAADLLAQQGPQVGQLRLLGLRLDWAELR